MTKEIVPVDEEFNAIAEEISSTMTERVHNAREEMILAHHETGKIMAEFLKEHPDVKPSFLIKRLENMGAAKETTLYLSLQCYAKWPNYNAMIEEVGQGKNTSWNKVRAILAAPKSEKPDLPECSHSCNRHCKA